MEEVLLEMERLVRPGISTIELNDVAADIIKSHGATASFLNYKGFPYSICASINEQVVHGFSGKRVLKDGDIISVDVGAKLQGWHGDAARTFLVGNVAPEIQELVRVTKESFFVGIKQARASNRLYDISAAIQEHAERHGYGVVRELVGHGIGRSLHEAPDVPNYAELKRGRGPRLRAGMTLAVEPMINMGTADVWLLEDQWTVVTQDGLPSAHYENTIAITDDEPLLLTCTCQNPEEKQS